MLSALFPFRLKPGCRLLLAGLVAAVLLAEPAAAAPAAAAQPTAARRTRPLLPPKSPVQPPKAPVLPPATTEEESEETEPQITLPLDQRPPAVLRQPRPARLRELSAQSDFHYVSIEEKPRQQSLWSLFWLKLWQWITGLFSGPSYEHKGRYVVYGLFGAAFLFVLLRLLKLDLTGLSRRRTRAVPLSYETASENIHAVDFGAALAEAEAAGNYRLAVRLGYLLVLRHLTERDLIRWQPEKTNHDYLRELAGTRWAADFAVLTRQFEYVWYGELPLTPAAYPALRETRQQFLALLTRAAA